MCGSRDDHVRTFRSGSARLTQCLECHTLGIQVGSAYFAVQPSEIQGLAQWFFNIRKTEARRIGYKETLYLQIESSRIMLALSLQELEDLLEILRQGFRWASADPSFTTTPALSEAVH